MTCSRLLHLALGRTVSERASLALDRPALAWVEGLLTAPNFPGFSCG